MIDRSTSPPTVTAIATGRTREDALAVGPDGCLYASQSTAIEKITPSSGPCSFVAASVLGPRCVRTTSPVPVALDRAGSATVPASAG